MRVSVCVCLCIFGHTNLWVCVCVCVLVSACSCVSGCTYTCVHACVCGRVRGEGICVGQGFHSSRNDCPFFHFTFLRQDLPLAWTSPSGRGFLVSKPCGLSVVCLSAPAVLGLLRVGHHGFWASNSSPRICMTSTFAAEVHLPSPGNPSLLKTHPKLAPHILRLSSKHLTWPTGL